MHLVDDSRGRRDRADRCPGVLRPWLADDGALIRLRVVGGELPAAALAALMRISAEYAEGTVHLTRRANLQLRGIAHRNGCVPAGLVDALTAAGLLPAPSHELVRNIMVSPLTGRVGGRSDLRPVATALDEGLCADPVLATLPGRFLFVLDDGRGDLADRSLDLGLMAVDDSTAQLRVGSREWGPVVPLPEAPGRLLDLGRAFLVARGEGDSAAWHVDELDNGGTRLLGIHHARDLRSQVTALPLPHGTIPQDDGRRAENVVVPDGRLTQELAADLLARAASTVIVTPWRSVVLPDLP
jgi:precorrin-3B synthase